MGWWSGSDLAGLLFIILTTPIILHPLSTLTPQVQLVEAGLGDDGGAGHACVRRPRPVRAVYIYMYM